MIQFHDYTNLPWWSTIILSTFLTRSLVTLPLAISQQKNIAKFENIVKEEMPALAKEIGGQTKLYQTKFGISDQEAAILFKRSVKKQHDELIQKHNCHPAKAGVLILFQIPLWITNSCAIRNLMSGKPDPESHEAITTMAEFALGGFAFIPNLLDVDHSLIFPVTFGILNLVIIELSMYSRTLVKTGKFSTFLTNFFRIFVIYLVYISSIMPSGLTLYWWSSSLFGFGQNLLLLSPKFRRLVKIPKSHSELEKPYSTAMNRILEKFKLK